MEGEVETAEEGHADFVSIGVSGAGQRGKVIGGGGEGFDHVRDEDHETAEHGESASQSGNVEAAAGLGLEVEEHDDEKEKDHDRAGIDEDLDDPDEEGVEGDKKSGEGEEGKNETHRAVDRVAEKDDGRGRGEHQHGEDPEQNGEHAVVCAGGAFRAPLCRPEGDSLGGEQARFDHFFSFHLWTRPDMTPPNS